MGHIDKRALEGNEQVVCSLLKKVAYGYTMRYKLVVRLHDFMVILARSFSDQLNDMIGEERSTYELHGGKGVQAVEDEIEMLVSRKLILRHIERSFERPLRFADPCPDRY